MPRADGGRALSPRTGRLSWSRFRAKLVIALGMAWILGGLEITIAGNRPHRRPDPEVHFDTLGRRKMIAGTCILSGVPLVITAQLSRNGRLNATIQTLRWAVIFFAAARCREVGEPSGPAGPRAAGGPRDRGAAARAAGRAPPAARC